MIRFPFVAILTVTLAVAVSACSSTAGAVKTSPSETVAGAANPTVGAAGVGPASIQVAGFDTANSPVSGGTGGPAPTITTSATGKASGTPDVVTVTLGVDTRSDSASQTLSQNNTITADVLAVLTGNGVLPADMQTTGLGLNPTYADNSNRITGYQAINSVTVQLRDVSTAGAVIDAVAQKAGDAARIQQVSFSIDDTAALRAAARADAVKQALAQADQLAKAAGVALGAVQSITESVSGGAGPYYQAASAVDASAVPLAVGSQDVSVSVQVVYAIA